MKSTFNGNIETKKHVYLNKQIMMNGTITVNDDNVIKWDTYFTEIKITVGREKMMHASKAQIPIEDKHWVQEYKTKVSHILRWWEILDVYLTGWSNVQVSDLRTLITPSHRKFFWKLLSVIKNDSNQIQGSKSFTNI